MGTKLQGQRLIVISAGYPVGNRFTHAFVRQLVRAISRHGVDCAVISPAKIHEVILTGNHPYRSFEQVQNGKDIEIIRPRYVSLSARKWFVNLGLLSPSLFTLWSFSKAVERVLLSERRDAQVLYGHFLYLSGAVAVRLGKKFSLPSFVRVGEGYLEGNVERFGYDRARRDFSDATGFIANSSLLKRKLVNILGIPESKIGVFPNGIDLSLFYPRNRVEMRQKFGLPPESFLVICVGKFSYHKGQMRVLEAIKGLKNVKAVFVGGDGGISKGENVAFAQVVPHEVVPELLSAADVFVLPTLIEGSCNSIIEAMGCGLPIVSSKGEFNDDILSEDMSIRVDPLNVKEIRDAIVFLKENPDIRDRMAKASLDRAKRFDINASAESILAFMEKRIEEEKRAKQILS